MKLMVLVWVVFSGAIAGTPFNIDRELLRKDEHNEIGTIFKISISMCEIERLSLVMAPFLWARVQLGGTTGGGYTTS